jgi:putative ABC transport system permease protein
LKTAGWLNEIKIPDMRFVTFKFALKSILFYRKASVSQILIVILLAAVITGSLFTGYSVRSSLKNKAFEKLGNTDILVSSGLRYFDPSLADRITANLGEKCVSILESDGYVQNFVTGVTILNAKIYGVGNDYFDFQGFDSVEIEPGTVAINEHLAGQLGIKPGEDLIIHFKQADPLPANAPFAPSKEQSDESRVMKVGKILAPMIGNFSLGISQIVPDNIFVNLSDLASGDNKTGQVNRLLIHNTKNYQDTVLQNTLTKVLTPGDLGLSIRRSEKTGESELISNRIFIDSTIVSLIKRKIPTARPLITYLANSIGLHGRNTPYSFVSALPPQEYTKIGDDEVVINSWLASDIGANPGDTIKLTWYDPGAGKMLEENSMNFIISKVIGINSPVSDPMLMPDFPGISGSTTCSGWDAGVPILLDKIREKDEDYWNEFRGTPKAIISYDTGKKIWGNNFGPATAIRFPSSMNQAEIETDLRDSFSPSVSGFTISDIRKKSSTAAVTGVDFSSLFLGLGIFINISCIILLSFAVSLFFDSRKEQVRTYFALGFKNLFIKKLLFTESLFYTIAGALPGVFTGFLLNTFVIRALNSVWKGAVQTDTLSAHFGVVPLVTGFLATVIIGGILLLIKVNSFLKRLRKPETADDIHLSRGNTNLALFALVSISALTLLVLSFLFKNYSTILSFSAGSFLFVSFILVLRHYYISYRKISARKRYKGSFLAKKYYSFNPAQAITPVIFIAAGIFAVIITGANRQVLNHKMLLPSGGTGGYLLWMESAVPVKENLNVPQGRRTFGFNEPELKDLRFVQAAMVSGDDASCLNLNHVSSPPLLGVEPDEFIKKGSFSFVSHIKGIRDENPWRLLESNPGRDIIYGVADQTVLEWGLKIKTGDTLNYRTETGQKLGVIICGGLKSSVFQGNILIGAQNISKYYPSVEGSSVFLVDGNQELSDYYRKILSERLAGYGVSVETAGEKLASFFRVTNTYLDVFTILGAFGMVLGVAGMGFVLIRNFIQRKREFALMAATGFSINRIRRFLLNDQIIILLWGILTGTVSGLISTFPSLRSGSEIPWSIIIIMVISITIVGTVALLVSVRMVKGRSLVVQLRRE